MDWQVDLKDVQLLTISVKLYQMSVEAFLFARALTVRYQLDRKYFIV